MNIIASLALVTLTKVSVSQIETRDGEFVSAHWMCGSSPSDPGSLVVRVQTKGEVRLEVVTVDDDAWLTHDLHEKPAALLTTRGNLKGAVLDVTVSIESGVYGYRRVCTYLVDPLGDQILKLFGKPIEFSDFGSWRRISPDTLEFWEADWSEEIAHQASHRYVLSRLKQSYKGNTIVTGHRTKLRYRVDLDSHLYNAKPELPLNEDPLRELGSRWTWWGSTN